MMANLRLLNPDYECLFFDDQQVQAFLDREFPQYRRVFDSFPVPIQRYDFFRYLAVYRHGGFYFDLDVLLASGLSDLLDSEAGTGYCATSCSRYTNWHAEKHRKASRH
jgi:inositol phosphorylceramide mannosyltransferase catalytic subunit